MNQYDGSRNGSLTFAQNQMAEDRHVFRSKSRVKGLGMGHVIGCFFCLRLQFRSTSSHLIASDGIRSGIGRKRKISDPCDSDSVELTIATPSPFFDSHWNGRFLMLPIPSPV